MYFNLYSKRPIYVACTYYFEIPQQVTNENTITLVYYLAQHKTVIPRVILRVG